MRQTCREKRGGGVSISMNIWANRPWVMTVQVANKCQAEKHVSFFIRGLVRLGCWAAVLSVAPLFRKIVARKATLDPFESALPKRIQRKPRGCGSEV